MKLRANSKSSKAKPARKASKDRTDLRSNAISALSVSLVIAFCGLILSRVLCNSWIEWCCNFHTFHKTSKE